MTHAFPTPQFIHDTFCFKVDYGNILFLVLLYKNPIVQKPLNLLRNAISGSGPEFDLRPVRVRNRGRRSACYREFRKSPVC